jgi:hypothetical protein
MTDIQIAELQRLIAEYDALHGAGQGYEIWGSISWSSSIEYQIKIFKKAKGRRIEVVYVEGVIDGFDIRYEKKVARRMRKAKPEA